MRGLEEIKLDDARRVEADRERRRKALNRRRHPTRAQLVDMTDHVDIDAFDRMLKALDAVVSDATSLSLDDDGDRAELLERLGCALGKVPERKPRVVRRVGFVAGGPATRGAK